MFQRLPEARPERVTLQIEDRAVAVATGQSVAAAVLSVGLGFCRTTPISGSPRAPYCMMGICFDCLMEIDGVANRQACMVEVREGMVVRRQHGAREVLP